MDPYHLDPNLPQRFTRLASDSPLTFLLLYPANLFKNDDTF